MGIILFNDKEHKYVGFNDGKHIFEDLNHDAITMTREAKLHLDNTPVTLLCKDGGEVEPTYQTLRKLSISEVKSILKSRGLNLSEN
jgi:hypothetical protein